ncbi:hypothetical protein HPB52_002521 [Rhipicephalus sanguineus]|uniref:DUF7041 domain-containing protein n=1 Tax=Rhipicephalus sanguineus TaxID=34632 RepID=A0A9D4PB31_RHISA|nr:hypothetical protein HPB52_002521 [Rhipicephalus sanguineus]
MLQASQLLVPLLLFNAMEPNSQKFQENATLPVDTLKLAEVWPVDSERTSARHRIAWQTAKYDHVVSALRMTTTTFIRDGLLAPQPDDPYDTLKRELLRCTTDSESRRIQQLLSSEELDYGKPSELLRHMTQLLGGTPTSTN